MPSWQEHVQVAFFVRSLVVSVYSLCTLVTRVIGALYSTCVGGECVLGKLLCPTVMLVWICSHLKLG